MNGAILNAEMRKPLVNPPIAPAATPATIGMMSENDIFGNLAVSEGI